MSKRNHWHAQSHLIRTARLKTGLSQQQVDTLLGSKKARGQIMSNIERGKAGVPFKHIKAICSTLNISRDDLVNAIIEDFADHVNSNAYDGTDVEPDTTVIYPTIEMNLDSEAV